MQWSNSNCLQIWLENTIIETGIQISNQTKSKEKPTETVKRKQVQIPVGHIKRKYGNDRGKQCCREMQNHKQQGVFELFSQRIIESSNNRKQVHCKKQKKQKQTEAEVIEHFGKRCGAACKKIQIDY